MSKKVFWSGAAAAVLWTGLVTMSMSTIVPIPFQFVILGVSLLIIPFIFYYLSRRGIVKIVPLKSEDGHNYRNIAFLLAVIMMLVAILLIWAFSGMLNFFKGGGYTSEAAAIMFLLAIPIGAAIIMSLTGLTIYRREQA